jgi:hypothetical protein
MHKKINSYYLNCVERFGSPSKAVTINTRDMQAATSIYTNDCCHCQKERLDYSNFVFVALTILYTYYHVSGCCLVNQSIVKPYIFWCFASHLKLGLQLGIFINFHFIEH